MNQQNWVFLNSEFVPIEQATVSVMDRGFLFADGVYEVIPCFAGKLFRADEHLARLQHSLKAIDLSEPLQNVDWQNLVEQLVNKNQLVHGSVYIQVTRGSYAERDHRYPKEVVPTVFARVSHAKQVRAEPNHVGVKLKTVQDIRWHRCDIKTTNLLANCMMRQQAELAGFDEALLVSEGCANECSSANVFAVVDGRVITPGLSQNILPGITRELVLALICEESIPFTESKLSLKDLFRADEVWITSSSRDLQPVFFIDDHCIGKAVAGPLWHRVARLFADYKQRLLRGECE